MNIYKHYKGGIYVLLGEALHTETNEILVIYSLLSACMLNFMSDLFVRPKDMFFSKVRLEDGCMVPRFSIVDNMKISIDS